MRTHRLLRVPLTIALIGTAVVATGTAVSAAAPPAASATVAEPSAAAAAAAAIVAAAPDISLANTRAHIQQLQNIANANGGTRRSTTAGYTASVNYVFNQLSAAGFTVVRQNCTSGCTAGAGPNVIADWPGGDRTTSTCSGRTGTR